MKADPIFIDTSGFYALLDRGDKHHDEAARILGKAQDSLQLFVTTDYIIDETATLLSARQLGHMADTLFGLIDQSKALTLHRIDADRFARTRFYFTKHRDQGYSFTDCSSFILMKELKLRLALTTDTHFRQAGFEALLV